MPQNVSELTVGSEWAYLQHRDGPTVCVGVLRIGKERPIRAKVRFLDDEFEGREEWVPRARLKAPWAERGPWQAREERWETVRHAAAPASSSPEYWAIDYVVSSVADLGVETGCGRNAAVLSIGDPDALGDLVGLTTEELASDSPAFIDNDGWLISTEDSGNVSINAARHGGDNPRRADAIRSCGKSKQPYGTPRAVSAAAAIA
jgi:hypothetical protein